MRSSTPERECERVLFTCGREPAYPRNALILSMLEKRFRTSTFTNSSRRMIVRYSSILWQWFRHPRKKEYDLLFIGFLGQPLVAVLGVLWKKPILFDAFISLYDTICFDRQWASTDSLAGKAALWLDRISCGRADRIILDTQAHANYFENTFDIPKKKFHVLYVGCDEDFFFPRDGDPTSQLVLFYGSFLPLHGLETILQAAFLLRHSSVRFRVIGDGIGKEKILSLAKRLALDNVEFVPSVKFLELPGEIANAAICLGGHFGTSEKAKRVIAGKTFQCLAMAKPTIVGDNEANGELLVHNEDAWFCTMGDPAALAQSIDTLMRDPKLRMRLGENARQTFLSRASKPILSTQLYRIMDDMISE